MELNNKSFLEKLDILSWERNEKFFLALEYDEQQQLIGEMLNKINSDNDVPTIRLVGVDHGTHPIQNPGSIIDYEMAREIVNYPEGTAAIIFLERDGDKHLLANMRFPDEKLPIEFIAIEKKLPLVKERDFYTANSGLDDNQRSLIIAGYLAYEAKLNQRRTSICIIGNNHLKVIKYNLLLFLGTPNVLIDEIPSGHYTSNYPFRKKFGTHTKESSQQLSSDTNTIEGLLDSSSPKKTFGKQNLADVVISPDDLAAKVNKNTNCSSSSSWILNKLSSTESDFKESYSAEEENNNPDHHTSNIGNAKTNSSKISNGTNNDSDDSDSESMETNSLDNQSNNFDSDDNDSNNQEHHGCFSCNIL